jgi:MtaA/CmuA family methyltransferase
MNSYERVMHRLCGEPIDRIPNFDIMMTYAAHYIHEPLSRYYHDYRVLCAANYAVQQEFALDIVQAISDPYREASDLGSIIEFPEDDQPILVEPLLREYPDLDRLRFVAPEAGPRMDDRLHAIRAFRDRVGGQVPIMGWVEGAIAEAADLRGVSALMLDLNLAPEWVEEVLERCAEVEIAFARAQVQAGADIIGLGDAVASMINAEMYMRYALPYEQRIFAAVHELGALARLHICGRTTHLLDLLPCSGADIIDLDSMVDLKTGAEKIGSRAAICGNFNPVTIMLQGTPQSVSDATRACIAVGGPRLFSGAGCEIPDSTPMANLYAQAATLVEIGPARV